MKIDGGYYIKARCIQNSEIAIMPPYIREIWDWLLKEANHSEKKVNGSVIKRGQLVRTFKDIQEGLHWMIGWRKMTYKKWQCENAMKFLRERSMITTTKTTRGMLIDIDKYSYYQDPKNYENNRKADRRATDNKQTTDTINKNVKNDKNVNSTYSLFDFWNSLKIIVHKDIKGKVGNRTFKGCLEQALDDNTEETIREAMQNYKTILEGEEYFWKYRWTIGEFLIRGLDKFLTINKPFENFAIKERDNGGSNKNRQHYRTDKSRKEDKYKELYEI